MPVMRCLPLLAAILLLACSKAKRTSQAEPSAQVPASSQSPASSASPASGQSPESSQVSEVSPVPFCEAGAAATTWARRWEIEGAVGVTTDGEGRPLLQVNSQRGEVNLVKLDNRGATVWSHAFPGNGRVPTPLLLATNRKGSTVVISNNVYEGKLVPFLALIDASGKQLWLREPVKSQRRYFEPMAVAIDAEGGSTAMGIVDYPLDLGRGMLGKEGRHAFVFKLDAKGSLAWNLGLGGLIDTPHLGGFADGSVLLTGTLRGSLKLGEVELGSDAGAPFIAKLSPKGEVVFARVLQTDSQAAIHDVAIAEDGSSYLGLAFTNSLNLGSKTIRTDTGRNRAIVKLDAAGELAWSKLLGSSVIELSLATAPDNGLAVAAGFRETITLDDRTLVAGEWSTFAAKLDGSGKLQWLTEWQGAPEASPSVAADSCGIFVGARFKKTYDLGRAKLEREQPVGRTAAALLHLLPPSQ